MALIGNYSVLNKTCGRWLAGNSTAHASGAGTNTATKSSIMKYSDWRKFSQQDNSGGTTVVLVKTAAKPRGYYPPGAYALPSKAGEMAAWIDGGNTVTASMLLGLLMEADLTANGEASGTAGLVISMIAALTGSGAVSGAAALRLNMLADLIANGDVDGTLTGIANLTAALTGNGTMDGSTIMGIGYMTADITSAGAALTAAAVAAAVWDEVLANHLTPGSTGAALNAAGSAGDPWITTLPGTYTAEQAGGILYIIRQILKNAQKTDPETGIMTIYADDGTTVLLTANAFNNADENAPIPYDGAAGINRRTALEEVP
jgi:hypothetical protein